MTIDEDRCWKALVSRDTDHGGGVYAVRTTGIYCRFGCASRRPLRSNVEFFADPTAAERGGFRPCRRCRPELPTTRPDPDEDRVREACAVLMEADRSVTVAEVAARVGCSTRQLQRSFAEVTGVSVSAFRRQTASERARAALRAGPDVTSAIWDSGYASIHNFYREVGPTLGMNARDYRRGAPGRPVTFAVVDHRIGSILVAATPEGVCAIRVGPDPVALESELIEEFAGADVRRDDGALVELTGLVMSLADGRPASRRLPLDIEGTAFQVQVWEALARVRRGERVTYAELARRIGRPTAHRAVGAAVGANPVALALPCHRVVRSDGGLGGFRWGIDVKEALLAAESDPAGDAP